MQELEGNGVDDPDERERNRPVEARRPVPVGVADVADQGAEQGRQQGQEPESSEPCAARPGEIEQEVDAEGYDQSQSEADRQGPDAPLPRRAGR